MSSGQESRCTAGMPVFRRCHKYVGRGYNPKNDNGYTIKLNGAMMFDTMENAIKTMDWFGIEGSIGEVKRHTELVQVLRGSKR